MMKALSIDVRSGFEKNITPEDKWTSENSVWTDSDDTPPPTAVESSPPIDDDDEIHSEQSPDPVDPSDSDATEESDE